VYIKDIGVQRMVGKKVVVIGLDGATWDLLKPWADQGELPTLKKLMETEHGAYSKVPSLLLQVQLGHLS
jgi:predicted AlkP superfamily phosphohydrolase/phosphomutase